MRKIICLFFIPFLLGDYSTSSKRVIQVSNQGAQFVVETNNGGTPTNALTLGADGVLSLNSPLGVSNGGTGANNSTTARTNLGLGSIATQNSNNVSITGGSISDVSSLSTTGTVSTGGGSAIKWKVVSGTYSCAGTSFTNLIQGVSITGVTGFKIDSGGTVWESFNNTGCGDCTLKIVENPPTAPATLRITQAVNGLTNCEYALTVFYQ